MDLQEYLRRLRKFWGHISRKRGHQFSLLLLLMLFASAAEMISIGAVLPFLMALMDPEKVFQHAAIQPLVNWLNIETASQLLLPLTALFIAAALISGGIRLLLTWASVRLSFATGADISINIYRRTLHQPYSVHTRTNSSTIISGIITKVGAVINNVVYPLLTLVSSAFLLIAILVVLLLINVQVTLITFAGFGFTYLLIIKLSNNMKLRNGQRIATESNQVVKSLQEGLGGIRDILLDGAQDIYCQSYRKSDLALRRAQGTNQILALSPRFIIESLGMALIAAIAYYLAGSGGGIKEGLPVIGAIAVGAQRLLPVMQQAYASWSSIQGGHAMFADALELLEQPMPEPAAFEHREPLPFEKELTISEVGFRYSGDSPWIFERLNLRITRGTSVGIVGTTGSGKSTLLDLIMGLLHPTHGTIQIDGVPLNSLNQRAWQAHIAHVPQSIFLTDNTILENIAFGVPRSDIDHARAVESVRLAQMGDTIESWPDGYETVVGERGVRLSGGQKQRLGIARALYKQADVIVLDEATSALDSDTERTVMRAIEGLDRDLTLIIIAHRFSTLSNCDEIIELQPGGAASYRSYDEISARTN